MKAFCLCLTLLLLALPRTAGAGIIETGQDLDRACRAPDELSDCLTFLQAVHKTVKEVARTREEDAPPIVGSCGPDKGIDTLPLAVWLRDSWYAYAARHPDQLHRRAAEAVLLAIEEQWPCETTDQP